MMMLSKNNQVRPETASVTLKVVSGGGGNWGPGFALTLSERMMIDMQLRRLTSKADLGMVLVTSPPVQKDELSSRYKPSAYLALVSL